MNTLTIIPENGLVMIDGRGFDGLDMTGVPNNIHAIQWYGSHGEVEYKSDSAGNKPQNSRMDFLSDFLKGPIAAWEAAKEAKDTPPPHPEPTIEQVIATLDTGLMAWIREQITFRTDGTPGFTSVDSAVGYIGNTVNPLWSREGEAIRDWNTICWVKALELLDTVLPQVVSGKRLPPTLEEVIAEMPKFVWPT